MVKDKQSFFEKISGGKKTSLAAEEADKDNLSIKVRERKTKEEDSNEPQEGQLAVDVYETNSEIVVESIIGGVNSGDINISVLENVLTIKGIRQKSADASENVNYFVSECFWGNFSRSIILPCEVDADAVKAVIKKGVLKIILPKLVGGKTKKIIIEEA